MALLDVNISRAGVGLAHPLLLPLTPRSAGRLAHEAGFDTGCRRTKVLPSDRDRRQLDGSRHYAPWEATASADDVSLVDDDVPLIVGYRQVTTPIC